VQYGKSAHLTRGSLPWRAGRTASSVRCSRRAVGVLADCFWRMPGTLRSDSPHAFAAVGPHAERITLPHPVDVPHGLNSPPGRAGAPAPE